MSTYYDTLDFVCADCAPGGDTRAGCRKCIRVLVSATLGSPAILFSPTRQVRKWATIQCSEAKS